MDPAQQTQLVASRLNIFDINTRKSELLGPDGLPLRGNIERPILQMLIVTLLTKSRIDTLYLFPKLKDSFTGLEQTRDRIATEYEKAEQPALKNTGWVNITIITDIIK